jgi:reactive intermediate/imine deaminase
MLPFAFAFSMIAVNAASQETVLVRHINPPALSKPTGYSHVVEVRGGRTLYISGQIAVDKEGSLVGAGDVKAQAEQVFENLKAALAAGGATFNNVVKLTYFVTDASQVQVVRAVRDRYVGKEPPASSFVQVARLVRPELLIEVEAIAVVE